MSTPPITPPRVTVVISHVTHSRAMAMLDAAHDPAGVSLRYVLLNPADSELEQTLRARGRAVRRVRYRGKRDAPAALLSLLLEFIRHRPQVVHAHLFDASLWAMTAAWLLGIRGRLCTRHYSTFHHDYHPQAVRYDRWVNARATQLIAISPVVERVLVQREGVSTARVALVPHGFDLNEFAEVSPERVAAIRQRYGLGVGPVIGAISRFTHWKGLQHLIPAFAAVRERYPTAQLVLANAVGEYVDEIQRLIAQHGGGRVVTIAYEADAPALLQAFDVFAHLPIDADSEAYGQVYVEAMAAARPMVCTLSGIAHEVVAHARNALVVPYAGAATTAAALLRLLDDRVLAQQLGRQAQADVARFEVGAMARTLEGLYLAAAQP